MKCKVCGNYFDKLINNEVCQKCYKENWNKTHKKQKHLWYEQHQEQQKYNHKDYYTEGNLICSVCGAHRKKLLAGDICIKCYKRNWSNNRRHTDPTFKIIEATRNLVKNSFKRVCQNKYKKNKKVEDILGCSMDEFIKYIVNQFKNGMTLENYGEWELDHIIPISSAQNDEDIYRFNHYTNFQPLWSLENKEKGKKILNNTSQEH